MIDPILRRRIGRRIRLIRQILFEEESQEQFAKRLGTSQRAVSYWETGHSLINTAHLIKLDSELAKRRTKDRFPHLLCWLISPSEDDDWPSPWTTNGQVPEDPSDRKR